MPGERPVESLVCAVVAPPATKIENLQLDHARREFELRAIELAALRKDLTMLVRRRGRLITRLTWLERFVAGRGKLDHSVGRIGGFFIAITQGGALLVLIASITSPGMSGIALAALVGILLAAIAYLPFSVLPDDARLAEWVVAAQKAVDDAAAPIERLQAEEQVLSKRAADADTEFRRLETLANPPQAKAVDAAPAK